MSEQFPGIKLSPEQVDPTKMREVILESLKPKPETSETGAVREHLYPPGKNFPIRLDLLLQNTTALKELAEIYGLGIEKGYPIGNWKKGFKESVLIAHMMEHIRLHLEGDTSEKNHLGNALWNLWTLIWVRKNKPELMDLTGKEGLSER